MHAERSARAVWPLAIVALALISLGTPLCWLSGYGLATQYEDDVRKRIEAVVQRKVEGQEIAISTEAEQQPAGQVIDLMEALRASLAKTTAKRAGEKKAEAPAAEAAKTASRKPPKKVAAEAPEPKRKVRRAA